MGKKKKFFDKKKSATFQLIARDSSDPNNDGTAATDRFFFRVDDNHAYPLTAFDEAPVDASDSVLSRGDVGGPAALPENVRREILELGFPDDGYNYLFHLREIKNTGGGSAYYENPKAKLDQLPRDEKVSCFVLF